MARTKWRGTVRIGLVTIPVKMYGSIDTKRAGVTFNQLHDACGGRIRQKRFCPDCDTEVASENIQKGFEHEKGRYVVVTEADIASVEVESTHTIDVQVVVPPEEIEEVLISGHDYLTPDGPVAAPAFTVIRDALGKRVAIGTLAQRGKETVVAIRAKGPGLLLQTLYAVEAVRDIENLDELDGLPTVKRDERNLADNLLASLEGSFLDCAFPTAYDTAMKAMLTAKAQGNVVSIASKRKTGPKVSDLRAALTASLAKSPKKKVRRKKKVV